MPPPYFPAAAERVHWCAPADRTCRRARAAKRSWKGQAGGALVAPRRPWWRCCVQLIAVSHCIAAAILRALLTFVAGHVDCGLVLCGAQTLLLKVIVATKHASSLDWRLSELEGSLGKPPVVSAGLAQPQHSPQQSSFTQSHVTTRGLPSIVSEYTSCTTCKHDGSRPMVTSRWLSRTGLARINMYRPVPLAVSSSAYNEQGQEVS